MCREGRDRRDRRDRGASSGRTSRRRRVGGSRVTAVSPSTVRPVRHPGSGVGGRFCEDFAAGGRALPCVWRGRADPLSQSSWWRRACGPGLRRPKARGCSLVTSTTGISPSRCPTTWPRPVAEPLAGRARPGRSVRQLPAQSVPGGGDVEFLPGCLTGHPKMRFSAYAAWAGDSAGLVLTACQDAAARGGSSDGRAGVRAAGRGPVLHVRLLRRGRRSAGGGRRAWPGCGPTGSRTASGAVRAVRRGACGAGLSVAGADSSLPLSEQACRTALSVVRGSLRTVRDRGAGGVNSWVSGMR